MKNKKFWIVVGAVAVTAAIIVGIRLTQMPVGPSENVVNVAMNIPITGPFGIYGQTIRDGALFALDDLSNQKSKIRINANIQDNAGETKAASNVFQQQMLSKVDIYVSGVKPQTLAIFDNVIEKGVPYFVWIFDAFVTDKYPTVFRTWVNYKYEPEKYFQYIKHKKAKRVAIACVNFPHTVEEFRDIVIPQLSQQGVQTVIEIYEWNIKEYRDLIVKLRAQKPDLYILNGFQENLVGLVKALRTYGLVAEGNVIGTYDLLDAANLLTKDELEGLKVIAPDFNIAQTPRLLEWKQNFKAKYNREPLYTDAYSYDMVMIIADAAKRLTLPATSEQWIRGLMETNINGITGPLTFDKGGDLVLTLRIGNYVNGVLELDQSEQEK